MPNPTASYNPADVLSTTETATLQAAAQKGYIAQVLLGKLTGANMNVTTDQAITINSANYIIRRIVVTNASISLDTAVGGVYAAGAKATALVANTQVYSALTAATKTVDLTLNALALSDRRTGATIYLSLTTPQGAAATADVYVFGDKLD